MNYDCPLLNIGERKGDTSYIDFIEEKELGEKAVMKGKDCIGRFFLAIKAEYVLSNGKTVPTFSTFFKRYVDADHVWQCCGHDGIVLMHTDGGMQTAQFDFLNQLLYETQIDITSEMIQTYRLNYYLDEDTKKEEAKKKDQETVEGGDAVVCESKPYPLQLRLRKEMYVRRKNPRFVF